MKSEETFLNCETLFYGLSIFEPSVMINDVYSKDDLLYLSNLGFSIVVKEGKLSIRGERDSFAKLIRDEIQEHLISKDQYHELADYVYLLCATENIFLHNIKNVIEAVEMENPIFATFLHVFEFIVENWKLNDAENQVLEKLRSEDRAQEEQYPGIRKKLFNY